VKDRKPGKRKKETLRRGKSNPNKLKPDPIEKLEEKGG